MKKFIALALPLKSTPMAVPAVPPFISAPPKTVPSTVILPQPLCP